MKLALLSIFLALPLLAQNPKPCSNVTNTASPGQILSATSAGSTPPCRWISAGGGGSGSVTSINVGNGLTASPNPIVTTGTISGINAAADGVTIGVAAFTAADFNSSGGLISLDYVNGQKATAGQPGFLSAADFTAFNAKQAAGNYITALTGDVAASGPGSAGATIQPGVVTLAQMANLAANSFIGNNTGSPATPIALTATQLTAALNPCTATLQGLVPAPPNNTTTFLRGDCTFAAPAGGGTVTSAIIAGTANQIGAAGTCTITTTGTCTISMVTSPAIPGSPTTTTQSQNDNSTKVATTAYTDLAVANGLASSNPATSVKACSAVALPAVTYANGASGIGATLTQNSAAVLVVDGYTVVLGDRILVKNQASTFQNGVYTVGTLGTGIIPFVLVRALDFDQPSDINNTGPIGCQTGTAGAPGGLPTTWLLTTSVTTIGTDAITFTQTGFGGNTVTAVSPGVGIAHFAGSTQTVTSSAVVAGDAPTLAVQSTIQSNGYLYCADAAGSATTYTCTMTPTLTAYTTGMLVLFKPGTSNSGASTLNIDTLGAKSIIAANTTGSALVADDLKTGTGNVYTLEYDGTAFRKINGPDTAWTGLTYSNGWGDFGSGNQAGQFKKDNFGNVCMRGLLALGTLTAGTTMATLPAGYRPASTQVMFGTDAAIKGADEFNVLTTGVLQYEGSVAAGTAFFMNANMCFTVY